MSAFLDSSAVVKLYADEEGSDAVRGLAAIAVSGIVRVEVPAALWRKARTGDLSEADARTLVSEFEADLLGTADGEPPRFGVLAVSAVVLSRAASLLPLHPLCAYDAVQLASALAAAEADPECRTFVCFDHHLSQAARAQGLEVQPDR